MAGDNCTVDSWPPRVSLVCKAVRPEHDLTDQGRLLCPKLQTSVCDYCHRIDQNEHYLPSKRVSLVV